ncbi:unnamed protein product, partial [Closterium sp. Yama58-4]
PSTTVSPARSAATSKATSKGSSKAGDPPSVWSRLLLRVDGLLLAKALNAGQAQALRGLAAARDARAADLYADVEPLEDAQVVRALLRLIDGSNRTLHVVHVCTELALVAQAGSLATWMAGLCRALRKKGHLVEVVLPLYSSVDTSAIEDFREAPGEIMSFFDNKWHKNKIYTGTVHGVPVTFVHPLHPAAFFQRDHLYDYEDDFERFTYFTRAALEYVQQQGKQPDVLHLHNWHTAVGAPLFWDIYHHQGMPDTRILFTCHDARFQNAQPAGKLALVGLDPSQLNRPDRLQDNRDPALVNLLKGGIVYSNKVTTVSPTYASDMKTRELGCGLDGTVAIHSQKFAGLPSGLDQSTWDPTRDLSLPVPITASDPMPGKAVARAEVRKRLGLPVIDSASGLERAVVAYVSPQIGEADVELIKGALSCSLAYQAQFVLVGAARSPKVQMALEELQRVQQDRNAHLEIVYEEDLVHLVVAAAHVLLCPPLRDPSSHLPLVGARYGAVPVARQLMGSPDSLVDVDDPRRGATEGTGFFYASDKPADAVIALTRALKLLKADQQRWETITKTAISRRGTSAAMIRFILLQNRQGKTRLAKYYVPLEDSEKHKLEFEVHRLVVHREPKFTNFVEFRTYKVIYRRYAGLFFSLCVDLTDNELAYLESIHLFVEILDHFFSNVCELDLVFNFHKVYLILDEFVLAGELQETSKKVIIERMAELEKADVLQPELEVTSPAFGADKGCSVEEFTDLSLREEEGDCSDPARDYTERHMAFSEGTAGVTLSSTKRARNERDSEGMWKAAKRRCVAFDCVTLPHLPSLGEPRIQPDVRKPDAHTSSPALEPTRRSTTSESPSPVSRPQAMPPTSPLPCPTASDLPVLSCPLTRFKRQRPPTIDIPRKGCFTSSPAGTPDSAAEDALDGVVEVAESGSCFAVACKRGRKAVMEDTYQALIGFAGRESDAFFGVFDGHGGTSAAKFAASELASHVAQAAAHKGAHASEAALVEGYLEADRHFLEQNVASGTSCLTCWATSGRLLLAHAGDCKAVLVKGGRAVALTEDHRAGREDEQARITALGGFVDTATGMPRVQGILAVTRGIGDAHLKAFITPQPDVAQVRVGADCSALILASDGLWDVVAPQDAADVVAACVGAAVEARAAAGEAQAAAGEVGAAASALLGPAPFPPSKRARTQRTQGCGGGGRRGSEGVTRGVDGEVLLSACQALVGMAAARGSRDDITVMLVSLAPFAESAGS